MGGLVRPSYPIPDERLRDFKLKRGSDGDRESVVLMHDVPGGDNCIICFTDEYSLVGAWIMAIRHLESRHP